MMTEAAMEPTSYPSMKRLDVTIAREQDDKAALVKRLPGLV